ncbi:hypothetical protein Gpo141_00006548 [Globisporangium polare]
MDAETLKAVNGQVGTLVMDLEGQVLSSAGQLAGDVGEQAAEAVFSILQDSNSVLDASKSEVLERVISAFTSDCEFNFPAFDYAVTLNSSEIYVVKRNKAALD